MKKFIRNVIIILYAAMAIGVTICLLSYNEYKISEFGNSSLVIIDNNELAPDFKKGDLLILDKSEKIKVGDRIFFYNTYLKDVSVSSTTVIDITEISPSQKTYVLEGDQPLSSDFVIGRAETATRIEKLGGILGVIESKWGFLILIVVPSLMAFLYEIVEIVIEIKNNKEDNRGR